jgi:hypothetical protein
MSISFDAWNKPSWLGWLNEPSREIFFMGFGIHVYKEFSKACSVLRHFFDSGKAS